MTLRELPVLCLGRTANCPLACGRGARRMRRKPQPHVLAERLARRHGRSVAGAVAGRSAPRPAADEARGSRQPGSHGIEMPRPTTRRPLRGEPARQRPSLNPATLSAANRASRSATVPLPPWRPKSATNSAETHSSSPQACAACPRVRHCRARTPPREEYAGFTEKLPRTQLHRFISRRFDAVAGTLRRRGRPSAQAPH